MDALSAREIRDSFSCSAERRSADYGDIKLSRRTSLEICEGGTGKGGWRSASREETREESTKKKIQISPPKVGARESSKQWEDELRHEMKALEICSDTHIREQIQGSPFSPRLLRQSILEKATFDGDNLFIF